MNDAWLQLPSVADRYAAFRDSLKLKPVDNTFGHRADHDTHPPDAIRQTPSRKVREIHNTPKRRTD